MTDKNKYEPIRETYVITAWNFVDTLLQVQDYVIQGWRVDVNTNEGYPQQFGTTFVITMERYSQNANPDLVFKDTPKVPVFVTGTTVATATETVATESTATQLAQNVVTPPVSTVEPVVPTSIVEPIVKVQRKSRK